MLRFTVRDLLLSTALFAAGLGLIVAVFASKPPGAISPDLGTLQFIAGGTLIGGGLLTLFKKTWIGFAIGALVALAVWFYVGMGVIMRM